MIIECKRHGMVKGYRVCYHVWHDGKEPVFVIAPSTEHKTLGILSCASPGCLFKSLGQVVTCEKCLFERGYISEANLKGQSSRLMEGEKPV
jgi:hypothetical protein